MIRSLVAVLLVSFVPLLSIHAKPIKETATDFLKQAEEKIYQPTLNGLESLAFEVNREYAPGKLLWSIDANWSSTASVTVKGSISESAPIPSAMKSHLKTSLPTVGEVLINEQLGRFLSYFQTVATPMLAGNEDGLIRVRLLPKSNVKTDFTEKILLFDNELVLRKAQTTQQDLSTLVEIYEWSPVEEGSSQFLLHSITASLKIQGMDITRVTTYNFNKIDRWHLFTSLTIKTTGIPNSPVKSEDLKLASFVVNGKLIEKSLEQ